MKLIEILKDEKGGFVFGPWWFVLIVIVLGIIASLLKNNETKNEPKENFNDYNPNKTFAMPLQSNNNICNNCGKNTNESAKFCSGCGVSLIPEYDLYCPGCGVVNQSGSKFCQECGNKL